MKKLLTLCIIHKDNRILLGYKKRGFGEGRWNGFGGKVEKGETIEQAAHRELEEEAYIKPTDLKKRGVFEFTFQGNPEMLEVHLFSAKEFTGDLKESEEMRPKWFGEDEIPFEDMWPDDIIWFPLFLSGKNFNGKFHFKDKDKIISHSIEVI
jgi:8-oxo-dGTP diphosphatase / 2-hydroxy-dATP diphosphatase